ncbi:MAG TPA: S8 family serine peptidase [Dyella sp.]|nr:S8 family serine peptidase [Dyella sp.]
MKYRAFLLVATMAGLSACAHAPTVASEDHRDIADSVSSRTPVATTMNTSRDIVLAVANPIDPPATHAGSSVLGYIPPGYYGAGQRAISELSALKQSYNLHEVAGWPIKALGVYCVVLEPPPGADRDALLKTLAKDDRVRLAQPLQDYSMYADASSDAHHYNDPYANLQRGFVETDAALAHTISQGEGVRVAIVDTGVDTTHPELKGRIHDVSDAIDGDASGYDRDYHGTEVAGIIAADGDNHQGIVGIAPKVTLSVYKACWYPQMPRAGARCNTFTLAKALAAIIDTNTRIINLSLGGPPDPLLDKLLTQLLDQGRIIIAAMPPDGKLNGFPDHDPGVIVVRTSGSSSAPPGVLSAPGKDILTTQPGGGYDFTSGSSMAAAHVSGIAALLLSIAPKLDARTVHDLLLQNSKVSDGMLQVNAAAAVTSLQRQRNAKG